MDGIDKKLTACDTDAACDTLSKGAVTSAFAIGGIEEVAADPPATTRRNLATTYQTSATGGATAQPDPTEDD